MYEDTHFDIKTPLLNALQVPVATAATAVELAFPPVFASMQRKMHCWRPAGSESARVPFSTVIREY